MSSNIIIRKALPSDIESLISLLESLFEIETDFTFERNKQRCGLEMILAEEKHCCILVAELHQQIVGMCTAQLVISTAEGGLKAIIEDLVILEGYRHQGNGKKIIGAIERWACSRGVKRLDLLADCRNNLALQFYEKNNWESTELICLQKKL